MYDVKGSELQVFDHSSDTDDARDLSCCSVNPSGDAVVVGGFNRLYVYSINDTKGVWEQVGVKQVS